MPATVELSYSQEMLATVWDEVWPLFGRHKTEVSPFLDWELKPNKARYLQVEAAGGLRLYCVRDGGVLVGYVIFIVGPHPHHVDWTVASDAALFVEPRYRTGVGGVLVEYARAALTSEGEVDLITLRTRVTKALYAGKLFKRLGFSLMEEGWVQRITSTRKPS